MSDTILLLSNQSEKKKQKKSNVPYVYVIVIVAFVLWYNIYMNQQLPQTKNNLTSNEDPERVDPNLTYILLWTPRKTLKDLGRGQESFISRKCPDVNCYVSSNRWLFNDIRKFDVIVFHAPDIKVSDLPKFRSPHQKYVFASTGSSQVYRVCGEGLDDYFNLTWTYKLNSDIVNPFFIIKDSYGNVIGPKENIPWKKVEEMDPISDELKNKISKKKIAAAWFASTCSTYSKRESVVTALMLDMLQYDMQLDIYGRCGSEVCQRSKMPKCLKMLEENYFYYLSFEYALSSDYVTEKLIYALNNFVVPVVYGGANYTRFMPPGTFLDASKLSMGELGGKMKELMMDKEQYYSYFKWHNHYSYHKTTDSPETDPYCNFCSTVNQKLEETNVCHDFESWWNEPYGCG